MSNLKLGREYLGTPLTSKKRQLGGAGDFMKIDLGTSRSSQTLLSPLAMQSFFANR